MSSSKSPLRDAAMNASTTRRCSPRSTSDVVTPCTRQQPPLTSWRVPRPERHGSLVRFVHLALTRRAPPALRRASVVLRLADELRRSVKYRYAKNGRASTNDCRANTIVPPLDQAPGGSVLSSRRG